jgi:DNA-binding response OmpR family regulator
VIRVLHVDDEAPIRLLARVSLEAEGMEVIEAADGRAGVQLAKREQPNLILLDVMMPVLDGWQAAEELRKDPETREIPIVFLTARSALKDRARGFDLGAVDYMLEPFNPVELAPRVRGVLERIERGERDELRREKISELRALMRAEVDDLAGRATSRTDFMRFLDALRVDLKAELGRPVAEVTWDSGEWSPPDLDSFLETFAAWLTASPSRQFDDLDSYAWQALAELLLAARVYE